MIRKTLAATKEATFSVDLPFPPINGPPSPSGTGFFVSADGWFLTAAHVVTDQAGNGRTDVDKGDLNRPTPTWMESCDDFTLDHLDKPLDYAILKVDLAKNKKKDWLKNRTGFPFLQVSARVLDEGEPVYAFGYPLPVRDILQQSGPLSFSSWAYSPRVTSAIVASNVEYSASVKSTSDPLRYVLDKALNYGNSGGPIVATETGRVHALCTHFQFVKVRQPHLQHALGANVFVEIPSLYGVVLSLSNPAVVAELQKRGVPITRD